MSPASYLTAPPRVAGRSIASRARARLARRQACGGRRQAVGRADRLERSVGTNVPPEHTPRVRMKRVEKAPVRAQGLVADAGLALDRRGGDGLLQPDAAVVG